MRARSSQPRSSRTRSTKSRSRLATTAAAAVSVLAGLMLVAGCSGDDSSSDPSSDFGTADSPALSGEVDDPGVAGEGAGDTALTQTALSTQRMQVVSAGLVVETDSVVVGSGRAEAVAVGAGGLVTDEETRIDPTTGDATSSLTLRVPPATVDDVLADLGALGDLVSQDRSTTDVTDQYVDVTARLESQRASLRRLLVLVDEAGGLDDVIDLEQEISRRQSDLDALDARKQALDGQVALATVHLTLTAHAEPTVVLAEERGFVAGLRGGWDAFSASVVALLTVLGAVLPFAVVVALVGVPTLVLLRRRRSSPA